MLLRVVVKFPCRFPYACRVFAAIYLLVLVALYPALAGAQSSREDLRDFARQENCAERLLHTNIDSALAISRELLEIGRADGNSWRVGFVAAAQGPGAPPEAREAIFEK